MKLARLVRGNSTEEGTFGRLSYGNQSSFTVELPWRDNLPQKSCIPTGSYVCKIVKSPKFGMVYNVTNVRGRSAVLIHSANFGGNSDLGYTTQLHGCLAPCLKLGAMRNNAGVMQHAGLISRPALRQLMDWANGENFTLEIT